MRVIFMGTPEFAIPPLEHLILNQYQVVAVYTQPDKPAGRGRSLSATPLKKAALAWKLPVVQPVSLKSAEVVAQLAEFHPEVIVVAAFGQILPQSVLDIPGCRCINIHPSLLPRFRGVSPVAAAILAGDEFTGVSIMLMDRGLDTGPVLARAQIPISAQDTTGSLTAKLSLIAAQLLLEILPRWSRGELTPQPQNEAEATYSGSISKEEGEVDWRLLAVGVWRRVRAFQPWPGCYTRWRGRQLKIIEAVPLPAIKGLEIGQVVALTSATESEAAFGVSTGEGILGVLKVQLEGKRAMSAAEFLRGQRGNSSGRYYLVNASSWEVSMEWQQLITGIFMRISRELERVLGGLTVDDLNQRPSSDCNSIGWLAWHLTRIQDLIITEIMEEEQLWIKDKWYATFNRAADSADTGWRHSSEDVAAFRSPESQILLAYHHAVLEQSKRYTKNKLTETDLKRKSKSPTLTSVNTVCRRLVGFIDEGFQHVGQAAYVRGLLKGKGWLGR